ncbi:MAG TPA: alpha-glucuronidase family glycosyl hydrolase [Cellvibrionaceae bacterium]
MLLTLKPVRVLRILKIFLALGGLFACVNATSGSETKLSAAQPGQTVSVEPLPKVQTAADLSPYADENGSKLWLRLGPLPASERLEQYKNSLRYVVVLTKSATTDLAKRELIDSVSALIGRPLKSQADIQGDGAIVVGTSAEPALSPAAASLAALGADAYTLQRTQLNGKSVLAVVGNSDIGALYGTYALLRHLQSQQSIEGMQFTSAPKIQRRLLNHWDNLDGSVERGYAGRSLWNWAELPGKLSPRYKEYARANASIGINGTVLNNVNANAQILTAPYLAKVKALADVFRPYGIRVYLTARFSAPIEIGKLASADPLDPHVQRWWRDKVNEIYRAIPDFGGFLVKANSEGQPGPQDYQRTHADGANMLADALAPHKGIVMWRAFVYASSTSDRIRQAYGEFQPLDGQFKANVIVQPKNGPLDFQPREPFHPLFGAMPKTPLALEVQLTKEYLGADTHLAYLGPLFEEVLQTDTYAKGPGSIVARIADGSLYHHPVSAIAGVANIGDDNNWTGSHFNQANWYAFGRMAWNPDISAKIVAEEWVRQTFSIAPGFVAPVVDMMMVSREALVNYMNPLGLTHIMANNHHYGPAPWSNTLARPEWNPVFYHRADNQGIGFDRTTTGSNALEQYHEPVRLRYANRTSVPNELLLFFHRVGWSEKLNTGRTLWEELVHRYSFGVDQVGAMREVWARQQAYVDKKRFQEISDFLRIQHFEARWWRDASLTYFGSVNNLPWPKDAAAAAHGFNFYRGLPCPPDVTKPRCKEVYEGSPSPALMAN